jgi:hypothetical protein
MDDNNSLNIFQMIAKSIEPTKDLVKKELLVFFVLSSVFFDGHGRNMKPCFAQLSFCLSNFKDCWFPNRD